MATGCAEGLAERCEDCREQACRAGVWTPYPAPLYSKSVRRVFEVNPACFFLGGCCECNLQAWRVPVMLTATALSLIALVLQVLPVISVSTDEQVVRDLHWTHGSGSAFNETSGERLGGADLYISISALVLDVAGSQRVIEWDAADCAATLGETCSACKDTASATTSVVIISLITAVVQLTTDVQRSTRAGDVNCQRAVGIFTGFLGLFTTLSSLSSFEEGCRRDLPSLTSVVIDGNAILVEGVDYDLGPSFICLFVATTLKIVDVVCHLTVTTPAPKRREGAEELFEMKRDDLEDLLTSLEEAAA